MMKFHIGRLKFVLPLSLGVAIASYIMLVNNYQEVIERDRILIVIGAAILTGVISYFLFPQEGDNPKDRGPY
jgi:predicted ABC-type exoprotein transport system permease subunit